VTSRFEKPCAMPCMKHMCGGMRGCTRRARAVEWSPFDLKLQDVVQEDQEPLTACKLAMIKTERRQRRSRFSCRAVTDGCKESIVKLRKKHFHRIGHVHDILQP